jgi:peptidoglycan/LPS O-acetylase OafA/YrhL
MEPEVHKTPVRFYEIDLLRFLAAIAVVFNHYTWRLTAGDDQISPVGFPNIAPLTKYGLLGVQLFFIISGYVVLMSAQGKTIKQFFLSRVVRLYPAFWVACTLTFLIERLYGPPATAPSHSWFNMSGREYLANMTMLHGFAGFRSIDGVYWTLTVEIGFYFLISLLIGYRLLNHLPLICLGWLSYVAVVGPAPGAVTPLFTLFIAEYAPYFIAGMLFYLLQTKNGKPWQICGLLLFSYLLALRQGRAQMTGLSAELHESFTFLAAAAAITVFFTVFALVITRQLNLQKQPWLAKLGALTYPLYLVHAFIGYIIFQHFGAQVNKYVLLIGLIASMIVLAWLIHTYVEKKLSRPLGKKVDYLLTLAANK